MHKKMNLGRVGWLAIAAVAALSFWQLSPGPAVQASPPVDQQVRAVAGVPVSFADVIEAVQPAVVNISVSGTVTQQFAEPENVPPGMPNNDDFQDFLRRFFGRQGFPGGRDPNQGPSQTFRGAGSGFIVDPAGYVVTNNHVVDHASEISVTLNDGRQLPAKLIGTDPKTDLALVKIESGEPFPYASFGDSDATRVGDWVVAIGNPFGLGGSASTGIVSARGRDIQSGPFDDFIQIDAPINQGNSGGPLFDLTGKVIGINTAIYSPNGGNVGIGFAIPSSMAKSVVDQLRTTGRVERGWLGVTIQPVDEDMAKGLGLDKEQGAIVSSVVAGSPAEKSGLEPGDVILGVGGNDVEHIKEVTRRIADTKPGETVELELLRNGQHKRLDVRVGESPNEVATEAGGAETPAKGLGLSLAPLTPEIRQELGVTADIQGVVIADVASGSPAGEKGLQPGDVIMMVGQTPVANVNEAVTQIETAKSNSRGAVLLRIFRQGQSLFVAIPVA